MYFKTLKKSLSDPRRYWHKIRLQTIKSSLVFLMPNIFAAQAIGYLINQLQTHRSINIFVMVNQFIFQLPLLSLGLYLVTLLLHFIAKLLKGRASLKQSFEGVAFCSGPFILVFIPIVGIFASFYQVYLLIVAFKALHQYSYTKAAINIVIPYLVWNLILVLLGLHPLMKLNPFI